MSVIRVSNGYLQLIAKATKGNMRYAVVGGTCVSQGGRWWLALVCGACISTRQRAPACMSTTLRMYRRSSGGGVRMCVPGRVTGSPRGGLAIALATVMSAQRCWSLPEAGLWAWPTVYRAEYPVYIPGRHALWRQPRVYTTCPCPRRPRQVHPTPRKLHHCPK